MFDAPVKVMFYVTNPIAEKHFWEAVGFTITKEEDIMGYLTFEMVPHSDSTLTFTVFDKAFIQAVSPEVVDNQPSVLFQTSDIEGLHAKIKAHAPVCNDITDVPFKNFNFSSPSGEFYAVQGV